MIGGQGQEFPALAPYFLETVFHFQAGSAAILVAGGHQSALSDFLALIQQVLGLEIELPVIPELLDDDQVEFAVRFLDQVRRPENTNLVDALTEVVVEQGGG